MSSSPSPAPNCGAGGGPDEFLGLRVASIFIILAMSTTGALFPVLARKSSWLHIPEDIFDFPKYFGSGVIIGTAFIHLLAPAIEELGSPCLSETFSGYPYALALCLLSIFFIFIVELIASRWGNARLSKLGVHHDVHGHESYSHSAHGPEQLRNYDQPQQSSIETRIALRVPEKESRYQNGQHAVGRLAVADNPVAHIVGVAILEFGIVLHSVLIGLTLAVDPNFKVLFTVLVFHQTFEGLGLGSRLACMRLPAGYDWVPVTGALLFGLTTPIGIAIGLGVRSTYNPASATSSIVSGILDALSAGILLYTGLVELMAHEFLFSKEMMEASNRKLFLALTFMFLGCGVMMLLGRWA